MLVIHGNFSYYVHGGQQSDHEHGDGVDVDGQRIGFSVPHD